MPTYSYACKECGDAFDVHQSFEDDALTQCPACGGALRKLFGRVGVVFKGSGFYRTDSRGGKSSIPATSKSETKAEPAASKPAETTAPAKQDAPAAKPASSSPGAS